MRYVWPDCGTASAHEALVDGSVDCAHTTSLALALAECQVASWQRWLPHVKSDAFVADQ
jgi:hypothetical protein